MYLLFIRIFLPFLRLVLPTATRTLLKVDPINKYLSEAHFWVGKDAQNLDHLYCTVKTAVCYLGINVFGYGIVLAAVELHAFVPFPKIETLLRPTGLAGFKTLARKGYTDWDSWKGVKIDAEAGRLAKTIATHVEALLEQAEETTETQEMEGVNI